MEDDRRSGRGGDDKVSTSSAFPSIDIDSRTLEEDDGVSETVTLSGHDFGRAGCELHIDVS